jgi:hypothetical protein
MKTISIEQLDTVSGGTARAWGRAATTAKTGVPEGAIIGVSKVLGGLVLKAGTTFTMNKGQTINLHNLPKFGRAH